MEWINRCFLLCFLGKFTLFSPVMQPWSELNFSKIKRAEPTRLASGPLLCSGEFGVHVLRVSLPPVSQQRIAGYPGSTGEGM